MKRIYWICLLLLASLVSCSKEEAEILTKQFDDVKEIRFVIRRGNDLDTVNVVTKADEILKIRAGCHIGSEQPFSKHIFVKSIVLVKSDGSSVHIPFEARNGRSIRLGSKQYQTNRETIDLLNAYFPAK